MLGDWKKLRNFQRIWVSKTLDFLRKFWHVSVNNIQIMAKFHAKALIPDALSGHLVIVLFCKAQTRASEGSFGKKAMKIKV